MKARLRGVDRMVRQQTQSVGFPNAAEGARTVGSPTQYTRSGP